MGARVFVLAMDPSSREANRAARWCLLTLVRPEDEVHVLVVRFSGVEGRSVAPIASSAKQEGLACMANTKAVHAVLHLAEDSKVPQEQFTAAVARAGSGAKGIARAIVKYAQRHKADLLVLGSRGIGNAASSVMSLVGLGSVSAHTLELADCPVAVVQGSDLKLKGGQHVLLLVESSTTSDALQWTLANVLRTGDHLHLLCVGEPTAKLGRLAGEQLPKGQLHIQGLPAQDSPSQLCEQVLSYVQDKGINTAVLARPHHSSTGSGSWLAASLRRLVGRSSLADRLLRQLGCPVIMLRD